MIFFFLALMSFLLVMPPQGGPKAPQLKHVNNTRQGRGAGACRGRSLPDLFDDIFRRVRGQAAGYRVARPRPVDFPALVQGKHDIGTLHRRLMLRGLVRLPGPRHEHDAVKPEGVHVRRDAETPEQPDIVDFGFHRLAPLSVSALTLAIRPSTTLARTVTDANLEAENLAASSMNWQTPENRAYDLVVIPDSVVLLPSGNTDT